MKIIKSLVLLMLLVSLSSCANAKTNAMFSEPNPVVQVVRDVREAVVQIKVEAKVAVQNNQNPFFNDDLFRFFFPQPQRERSVTSMGSGFIYEFNSATREAFIMTNNHVVERGRERSRLPWPIGWPIPRKWLVWIQTPTSA